MYVINDIIIHIYTVLYILMNNYRWYHSMSVYGDGVSGGDGFGSAGSLVLLTKEKEPWV